MVETYIISSWTPLKPLVQLKLTSKRLDEHIHTLVPVLVSSGSEQVDGVLEVKVIMTVEVTPDEIVDLLLGLDVQVLEFVHRGEFDDVETVGQDTV